MMIVSGLAPAEFWERNVLCSRGISRSSSDVSDCSFLQDCIIYNFKITFFCLHASYIHFIGFFLFFAWDLYSLDIVQVDEGTARFIGRFMAPAYVFFFYFFANAVRWFFYFLSGVTLITLFTKVVVFQTASRSQSSSRPVSWLPKSSFCKQSR